MARTTFGSHAYWRVVGLYTNFIAFSAVLFKDDTGTPISATGGTAIESGHSSTFAAANAFDGVDSTFWESTSLPCSWVGYHFGSAKTVMQMAIQRHGATMDGTPVPRCFTFQYSDDGTIWQGVCFGSGWPTSSAEMADDTPMWFDFSKCL